MADPDTPISDRTARNRRALLLFGRAAIGTLAVVAAGLGFMTGVQLGSRDYNPHTYAIGAGALCAAAFAVIAFMLYRRRRALGRLNRREAPAEELADQKWELH